ncbi:MAG: methyltransferase domain-containing protein [Rhodanobacteraceae bacterium]|nr:methyltransferase domain-containing protein [Rhodanobacteraceae bacterium]
MRQPTETPIDEPPRWWPRLLNAERRALASTPATDEREVWISSLAVANDARTTGLLDLCSGQRHFDGDLRAECGLWPLRDDSVDRVVLQHVLEVVDDVDALLDESLRVLKPERNIAMIVVGAWGWTRCRLQFGDSGAPALRMHSTRLLLETLAARGASICAFHASSLMAECCARLRAGKKWSSLCLIEARKRRELPNVRQLRARRRVVAPTSGWIARPTSRNGLAA